MKWAQLIEFEHSLTLLVFGIRVKTPFLVLWPLLSFPNLLACWVFPILLFSSISLHYSHKKALSLLAILWKSAFSWVFLFLSSLTFASFLFSVICKFSSDNHFAFLHFFFFGMILVTTSSTMLQTSFYSSSGTLPDLISLESICHLHYIILRD